MTTLGRFLPLLKKDKKRFQFKAIEISVSGFGFWESAWGMDIFINGIPVIKTIILANLIVWGFIFYSLFWW